MFQSQYFHKDEIAIRSKDFETAISKYKYLQILEVELLWLTFFK